MISRAIALGVVLALAGCAKTLDTQNISKFNQATTTLLAAVQETHDLDRKVVVAYDTEKQANIFSVNEPKVGQPDKGAQYKFPPPVRDQSRFEKAWQVRIAYAQSLQAYGAALASAAASPGSDDIETAVDNLQSVVTTFAPSLASAGGFDAASKVAEKAVTAGIMQARDKKLRVQIARAHPLIVAGRDLLAFDMREVAKVTKDRYAEWVTERVNALDDMRNDARISATQRHATYLAFTQDQQDMAASLQLLLPSGGNQKPGYIAAVDGLVAAHAKLLASPDDPHAADAFLTQAEAILNSLKSSS